MSESLRFVNPLDTVIYLKSLGIMDGLGFGELSLIAHQAQERHFSSGDVMIRPDLPLTKFYLLVSGEASVSSEMHGPITVDEGKGAGYLHALAQIRRGVEAVALTDVLALEFQVDAIFDFGTDPRAQLEELYRLILSRHPRPGEIAALQPELTSSRNPRQAGRDVALALMASREFGSKR